MKTHLLLTSLLILAGCDVPNSATRTTANGDIQIKLHGNLNCWDNRCMQYNAYNNSFSLPGRYPVRPPADAVQSGGYISVDAFQQVYALASRASFNGRENR